MFTKMKTGIYSKDSGLDFLKLVSEEIHKYDFSKPIAISCSLTETDWTTGNNFYLCEQVRDLPHAMVYIMEIERAIKSFDFSKRGSCTLKVF